MNSFKFRFPIWMRYLLFSIFTIVLSSCSTSQYYTYYDGVYGKPEHVPNNAFSMAMSKSLAAKSMEAYDADLKPLDYNNTSQQRYIDNSDSSRNGGDVVIQVNTVDPYWNNNWNTPFWGYNNWRGNARWGNSWGWNNRSWNSWGWNNNYYLYNNWWGWNDPFYNNWYNYRPNYNRNNRSVKYNQNNNTKKTRSYRSNSNTYRRNNNSTNKSYNSSATNRTYRSSSSTSSQRSSSPSSNSSSSSSRSSSKSYRR